MKGTHSRAQNIAVSARLFRCVESESRAGQPTEIDDAPGAGACGRSPKVVAARRSLRDVRSATHRCHGVASPLPRGTIE